MTGADILTKSILWKAWRQKIPNYSGQDTKIPPSFHTAILAIRTQEGNKLCTLYESIVNVKKKIHLVWILKKFWLRIFQQWINSSGEVTRRVLVHPRSGKNPLMFKKIHKLRYYFSLRSPLFYIINMQTFLWPKFSLIIFWKNKKLLSHIQPSHLTHLFTMLV